MDTLQLADGRAAGPRVLVVKADDIRRRRYHLELRARGFDVTVLDHGREALTAILSGAFELIFVEQQYNDRAERMELMDLLRNYLRLKPPIVIIAPNNHLNNFWTADRCTAYGVRELLCDRNPGSNTVHTAIKILGIDPRPARPVQPVVVPYMPPRLPLSATG
jgi:CheY-like chemotaxis protein